MATSITPARALAILVLAAGLLDAQCGGSKTTTPTPIAPSPTPIPNPTPTPTPLPSAPQVFVGAGDIGWNPADDGKTGGQALTAALIAANMIGGTVFTVGDDAYLDGSTQNFTDWYNPSWGQFLGRTRPTPGNHEYDTDRSMSGYFGYFGAAATIGGPGPPGGFYSFDLGDWHAVMLNSSIDTSANSPQGVWLQNDLATHPVKCTIAVFHFPLFSSGPNPTMPQARPLWDILYKNNVDVIVNGHDHLYERFVPQDPTGFPDQAKGIREFIVGTGGARLYPLVRNAPNSERRIADTYGVLKFTLGTGYDWQFIPVGAGQSDSGHWECH
jgi:hypothetical protein